MALAFAALYVGWLALRFVDSIALAAALLAIGLATAIWRWAIAGMAAIDILPRDFSGAAFPQAAGPQRLPGVPVLGTSVAGRVSGN